MHPLAIARIALEATRNTFRVPPDASSRAIRKSGAIAVLCGFVAFLLPLPVLLLARDSPPIAVMAVPALFGYALIAVGGYRVLAGKDSFAEDSGPSLRRIGLAVAAMLLFFGLPIAALIGFSILFEHR